MQGKGRTPVAFFVYNRPKHVRLALQALSRCGRLDECELHVYCDGSKGPEQHSAVEAARQVVREWESRLKCKITERDENLGLARSIVSGVSDLCSEYGQVIVLEDDLTVAPDFLDYMLQALDRYRDRSEVYQISGYMFPLIHPPKPDAFFLPLTTTWGWATWERTWQIFDWSAPGHDHALKDSRIRRAFDLDDSYPYTEMLKQRLLGENDSWGILWWWSVFQAGGIVLYPRRSLVRVGGFDGSGTHCKELPKFPVFDLAEIDHVVLSNPLAFPEDLAIDKDALDQVKAFLRGFEKKTLRERLKHALERFFMWGRGKEY